jgi:hypothetical protein
MSFCATLGESHFSRMKMHKHLAVILFQNIFLGIEQFRIHSGAVSNSLFFTYLIQNTDF